MSAPPSTPDPTNAPFEDLLTRLLAAIETDGPGALETYCAMHPEHAARLRAHSRRLSDWGLLATTATAARPETPVPGLPERLGDYRPLRRIGGGGMGNVYTAEQVALGRRVALKLIRPEQLWFPGARERFAREVHAIAKLQHPGIVPVHDAGETAGLPWLAMELVEGASLDEVLMALANRAPDTLAGADLEAAVHRIVAARGDVSSGIPATTTATRPALFTGTWVAACLRIARSVADALVHAHDRGVLHRDVKPSNVMLTLDGRALLLDFGLASSDDAARLTQDQSQLGSPAYMSPEQVRGERDVDARTDVWSLGVLLCELLTLRAAFADESVERTRARVLEARSPQLRRQNGTVSREVEVVCHTAISGERERRYASMRAFAADLDNLLERRPVHARPPTPLLVLQRWVQRRPATAIGALAAILVLVVAPTVFWLQQRAANDAIRDALATKEEHRSREEKARRQAQKDRDAAREVVQDWLTRVAAEELVDAPHMQRLRHDLLGAARDYHERFLADAADDPDLLAQAVESSVQLARIDAELGATAKTLPEARRALDLAQRLVAADGRSRTALAALARAKVTFAVGEHAAGRLDSAFAAMDEGLGLCREVLTMDPRDTEQRMELMSALRTAALIQKGLGNDDEVARSYAEVQDVFADGHEGEAEPATSLRQMAIGASADEGYFHLRAGRTAAALAAAERVLAWQRSIDPATRTSIERVAIARAFDTAARVRRAEGSLAEAEELVRQCLTEVEAVLTDLPQHGNALRIQAGGLNMLGLIARADPERRAEARRLLERSIATLRRLVAIDPDVVEPRINLATSLANLGSMLLDDDELDTARALFTEAADLAQQGAALLPNHVEAATTLHGAVWYIGQAAGKQRDHRAQIDAARRLAALRPDEARTQRIAGALLAEACGAIAKDPALAAAEREASSTAVRAESLQLLARAAELGCTDHHYLATHEHFAAVRVGADFAEIVAKMTANAAK